MSNLYLGVFMQTLIEYKTAFFLCGKPTSNIDQDISFLIHNRISLEQEYKDLERLYDKRINKGLSLDPRTLEWFSAVCLMLKKSNEKIPIKTQKYIKKYNIINKKMDDSKPEQLITFQSVRDTVGWWNMWRLNSRFAIITDSVALQFGYFVHLLESISQQNVDTTVLDAPIGTYNALSIGIFGCRFLINVIDIVQNLVRATEEEKKLPFLYRLYVELDKHEYQLGNDIVWGLINFFTNFPRFLHLTPPVANYVMGAFLVFDMMWMGRSLYKERQRFAQQRADYDDLILKLQNEQKANADLIEDIRSPKGDCDLILDLQKEQNTIAGVIEDTKSQKRELDYREENLTWSLAFCVGAGLLLLGGFSAAILLSPPAFVPLCFLVCNIGIAMYFSYGQFGEYMEKRMIHNDMRKLHNGEGPAVTKANDNETEALHQLGRDMLEYTFVPLVVMAIFAVSWPAALALTLVYAAFKFSQWEPLRNKLKELPKLVSSPTFFAVENGSLDQKKPLLANNEALILP